MLFTIKKVLVKHTHTHTLLVLALIFLLCSETVDKLATHFTRVAHEGFVNIFVAPEFGMMNIHRANI